ncbi:GNAT family N-acetyltransferase [Streptoalloteichus tenebrarius]|uniref:GNAT family N-acetyltransferase n=1 Tax=Streptoalloteichus tenebrarius (strain ATCC 17920 / DSM 40477 / JCM 4838 / CBS 697.72 / NBRC 16177 / NCIMB 11028 / NRRL B-12390 / A12253. 1 / ISP 5477) TaxID=1933 RepID=UPI0020A2C466|nr:GNAT family N-acetyltransferase [Streptoalloteichus tenebrarius]
MESAVKSTVECTVESIVDMRRPARGPVPPAPPLPVLGPPWTVWPARPDGPDLELVHRWMRAPHVAAFWRQAWPRGRWAEELAAQRAGDHSLPCLVALDGEPVAYLEVYRVVRDRLAGHYPHHPHDIGVHVAVGELGRTGRGLGRALLRAVARGLLDADPACRRVVAEPDVGNGPSIRAFLAAGFVAGGVVRLPDKTAELLVHPRTEEDLPR